MMDKNIFLAGIGLFFALAVFGFYVFGATVGEVSHPANQIKPGKFQLGDYFFPGRVGIGKNSTNHTLDVNGDISALSIDIAGTIRARDVFSSGGQNLIIGDDTFFTDIDSANILGIYGLQNRNVAGIVLGGDGPLLWGGGDTRSLLIRDRRGQDRANIQVNTVYTTTIEAQGTIKSVNGSQYYIVPFGEIKKRNNRCDRDQLYYQEKMLFCISGCHRWCQERKYSGGVITEFDPFKNLVGCVCLP